MLGFGRAHRWLAAAFTVAAMANIVALVRGVQAVWIGLLALLPLVLLMLTGLYMFALPYAAKWHRGAAPTAWCERNGQQAGENPSREFVLPDVIDRADPDLEKRLLSDLNMLAVTGGKERSTLEWHTLVALAGLRCNRVIPVSGDLVSVIECAPL
jgi:hypothetical protein